MEDTKIVDLYLARDEAAIHQSAIKYGRRLRALAMRVVASVQTAEECENDTYLRAWHSIPPHEPRNYLFAFLAKIVRNVAVSRARHDNRQKRSAVLVELSDEMAQCIPDPTDRTGEVDDQVFGEVIDRFLEGLSTEKRLIFLWRYWFMDPVSDIAARAGFTESKVKTMLFRLRKELKKYLEKEGVDL